ncbi:MAG: AAA family ATPase, partial [Paracoccaceae bacterium]
MMDWGTRLDATSPYPTGDGIGNVEGVGSLSPRAAFFIQSALPADNAAPILDRPYLLKGWFDCGALSVVYGPPNAGKSFLALDIAHHIAIGKSWAGSRVHKSAVLYIASEGGLSFQNRVAALGNEKAHGLIILPCSVDLGARAASDALPAAEVAALIEAIAVLSKEHGKFGLIVI